MRQYATTWVLALILLLSGAWSMFPDTGSYNLIIHEYRPMSMAWNVRYISDQLIFILYPIAVLLWKNNRVNTVTAKCFILLAIIDTLFYFWNYKTTDYGIVYFWYVGLWLLIYYLKPSQ
jgi:hypothetical protein